jgi:CTP:molybdopterin cytidylyltransferase MocA
VSGRIVVLVPLRHDPVVVPRLLRPLEGRSALQRSLLHARRQLPEATVVLVTNDQAAAAHVRGLDLGVHIHDRRQEGYQAALIEALDALPEPPDAVFVIEPTHPFRPPNLLSRIAHNLFKDDQFDTILAVQRETVSLWREEAGELLEISGEDPATVYIERRGLALAVRPAILRAGQRIGSRLGFEIVGRIWQLADLRDEAGCELAHLVAGQLDRLERQDNQAN